MLNSLHTLAKNWLEMSRHYRPSAFWFWNADMNHSRMSEVVAEMAANGIREFLIHPVHGMTIEYLSDEYFERFRYALTLAKQHGLKVWVYDEFGWPSGVAGGALLRQHPEYNGWFLRFDKDEQGVVTAVPAHPDVQLDNTLGAPWTQNEIGYLDTLSCDAVNCFIQMTHQRIYDLCEDLWSDVIVGFFTDEPTSMVINEKRMAGCWNTKGLPWTPSLPSRFLQMHGYDIEPHYTELADPAPCEYREHYWAVVKQMHVEAYHAQMADWCHAHGVGYTGHIGENTMLMQVKFAGSAFQCLSLMDEPGIDYLGMMPEPEDCYIEEVLVPSIARHSGHDRVYCEAFGISRYDLRLSDMLQRAQMFGIYGINDIALMGFHQALTGIRKRSYWPPLFQSCPWWEFYPQFRDAFARSVALPSLGEHQARYAIVYPQYQLEQNNPFQTYFGAPDEPVMPLTEAICKAIYEAGESFEFVFPEMMEQAQVLNSHIQFPYARYDALIAPSDFSYFTATDGILDSLEQKGRILRGPATQIIEQIASEKPVWADRMQLEVDAVPGSVRVFRYQFVDGELYALRNTTAQDVTLKVSSVKELARWDTVSGDINTWDSSQMITLAPQGTLHFSLTSSILKSPAKAVLSHLEPITANWRIITETDNTVSLAKMEFRDDQVDWVPAVNMNPVSQEHPRNCTGLPAVFRGHTSIEMRAQFECASIPEQLGILFEPGYLTMLQVNGQRVDLSNAANIQAWDRCHLVDILSMAHQGANNISACLEYAQFETSIFNDAFFEMDVLPSCDVFLSGDFRLVNGVITADALPEKPLPISLMEQGWEQYMGVMSMQAKVKLPLELARMVVGIGVDLIQHDCVELLLDGKSLGKRVTPPYQFDVSALSADVHTLTLRVSSTTGNLLFLPADWGVKAVHWLRVAPQG